MSIQPTSRSAHGMDRGATAPRGLDSPGRPTADERLLAQAGAARTAAKSATAQAAATAATAATGPRGPGSGPAPEDKASGLPSWAAGGIAGGVSKTATAPLDLVKLKQQTGTRTSIPGTLASVLRDKGPMGLFAGNGAGVARHVPYSSAEFAVFEAAMAAGKACGVDEHRPEMRFAAGALGGAAGTMLSYPLDLVRTRLALQGAGGPYKGVIDALRKIPAEEGGLRGLYRGLKPSLMGIVPYKGTNFVVYGLAKRKLSEAGVDASHPVLASLGAGMFAGAVGQTVAFPLELVRRRIQRGGVSSADGLLPEPRPGKTEPGVIDALMHVCRQDGLRGLYRGIGANYLKEPPAVAIMFATYELLKRRGQES